MKCIKCGKTFSSHTNGPEICWDCYMKDINDYIENKPETCNISNCDIPMPQGFGQQGWICPKCGRGVSPFVGVCPCSSDLQITYSSTTDMFNHAWKTMKTNLECKD